MRWILIPLVAVTGALSSSRFAEPACCYFSAMDMVVLQPGNMALLTWDRV
jgi:hypothetical protein